MGAARPLLVYDAAFEEARERRAQDRRAQDRRAYEGLTRHEGCGVRLDALFAATLINHIAAPERVIINAYRRQQKLRAGVAVNVKI